jgi:GNAT superfamily N-acetyltransferase
MIALTAFAIEPATESDLQRVASLYQDWVAEGRIIGLAAESEYELRQKLGPYSFVARADGVVVGFVTAIEGSRDPGEWAVLPRGGPYISIEDLYVQPATRSQGVGSALLRAAIEAGKRRGIEHVAVWTSSRDWERLIRFYRAFGLESWGMQLFK